MLLRPLPLPSAKYHCIDTPYPTSSIRHAIAFNWARPLSATIVMFHLSNIIVQNAPFWCPILDLPSIARNVECVGWEDVRITSIVIGLECVLSIVVQESHHWKWSWFCLPSIERLECTCGRCWLEIVNDLGDMLILSSFIEISFLKFLLRLLHFWQSMSDCKKTEVSGSPCVTLSCNPCHWSWHGLRILHVLIAERRAKVVIGTSCVSSVRGVNGLWSVEGVFPKSSLLHWYRALIFVLIESSISCCTS